MSGVGQLTLNQRLLRNSINADMAVLSYRGSGWVSGTSTAVSEAVKLMRVQGVYSFISASAAGTLETSVWLKRL